MINLIASDLEGTFLDDQNNFNENELQKQLNQMTEQNVRLAIISKTAYSHLLSKFQNVDGPIDFISENGAQIINNGVIVEENPIDLSIWRKLFNWLRKESAFSNASITLSGKMNAYTSLDDDSDKRLKRVKQDYETIQSVKHLNMVGDQIYQVRLDFHESNVYLQQQLINHQFDDKLQAFVDGPGVIYINAVGVSRKNALESLLDRLNIRSRQVATFGNDLNDYELLSDYNGYAVSNSVPELKSIAESLNSDNNDSAVQDKIQEILDSNDKGA